MKCAYCLDEMNEGARVCHECRRRQPISKDAKRVLLLCALGLAAISLGVYFVAADIQRTNKIDGLVICARFRGADKTIDARSLRQRIDALTASGSSWEDAYGVEAALLGCSRP
jgi:hypothetical protein